MGASWTSPLLLRPYCSSGAGGASTPSGQCTAPTLRFQPGRADVLCAALHVDVLCYASKGLSGQEVLERVVRQAVAAQLELMCQETQRRGELAPLRALHFLPPGLPHHVTLVRHEETGKYVPGNPPENVLGFRLSWLVQCFWCDCAWHAIPSLGRCSMCPACTYMTGLRVQQKLLLPSC